MIEPISEIAAPGDLRELNCAFPERYPFLLQSTANSGELGRFDILFSFPGEALQLDSSGKLHGHAAEKGQSFLRALDDWWATLQLSDTGSKLPFTGGWFLYLGYELAAEVEPGLKLCKDPHLPVAFAVRCPTALVYDHEDRCCYLVTESAGESHRAEILNDLGEPRISCVQAVDQPVAVREEEPRLFTEAVERAQTYIRAGDIYQANLSREWSAEPATGVSGSDIYASLCATNPAPFAGIACWQGTEIISSSPERLLKVKDGIASTRPIAGTRPRSEDDSVDTDLSVELFAHPKERAEHVMLIDLERNDLGRVCEAGSVQVDEMMVLESYAHVHHIVSNVSGNLRRDVMPGQAIAAVFPGGTITGCPKVRCMEIISELESGPRGAYTGSFGYLNRDGSLDLNILIRTIVRRNGQLSLRAGSGIVADSDAHAELEETRAKAKGMLRALGR